MRLLWKAVRAITVEAFGVVAVVWLLFSAAGLTVQDRGAARRADDGRAWHWVQDTVSDWTDVRSAPAEVSERERYVEEKLDRYSELYGEAAADYIARKAKELAREITARPEAEQAAKATDLFGSL